MIAFEELGCKFRHNQNREDIKESEISFHTSTPKSDGCDECMNRSECADCIVRHMLGKHDGGRKQIF